MEIFCVCFMLWVQLFLPPTPCYFSCFIAASDYLCDIVHRCLRFVCLAFTIYHLILFFAYIESNDVLKIWFTIPNQGFALLRVQCSHMFLYVKLTCRLYLVLQLRMHEGVSTCLLSHSTVSTGWCVCWRLVLFAYYTIGQPIGHRF